MRSCLFREGHGKAQYCTNLCGIGKRLMMAIAPRRLARLESGDYVFIVGERVVQSSRAPPLTVMFRIHYPFK